MKSTPDYLKFIIIVLAIIVGLLIACALYGAIVIKDNNLVLNQATSAAKSDLVAKGLVTVRQETTSTKPAANILSPALGPAAAPVTIYEYASFDCSFSQEMQTALDSVRHAYPTAVRLVWKDLPSSANSPVYRAHVAARCAQEQGKFWDYAALLWKSQNDFSPANLIKLAQGLKLDLKGFKSCQADKNIAALVDNDVSEADRLALDVTPYFFIGDQVARGWTDEAELKKMVEEELKK